MRSGWLGRRRALSAGKVVAGCAVVVLGGLLQLRSSFDEVVSPYGFLSVVHAAGPTIADVTGSASHGEVLTITGSSFGSKSGASPVAWDDFEDGTADTNPTVGVWERINGLGIHSATANQRHGHSSFNGKYDFGRGTAGFGGGLDQYGKWYAGYWFKLASNWTWGKCCDQTSHLGNVKFFRVWHSGSGQDNWVTAFHTFGNSAPYCTDRSQPNCSAIAEVYPCASGDYYWNSFVTDITKGEWHHLQMEYEESSGVNVADGTARVWFDGELKGEWTNLVTRCNIAATPKRMSLVGFYNSWGSTPRYSYWQDDSYIDNTWARVEIGDAPVYSDCSHRELQVPTAWSGNSISVTVNQGSFSDGETAYVFVVDGNGNVNTNGYPVSFGGGLAPPRNLRIVR